MSGFNIRRAREEDLDEIYRMINELADSLNELDTVTITPEMLRQDRESYQCVVEDLTTDDSIPKPLIGFALYQYKFGPWEGRLATLDNIYVAREHRGRGIGSKLLQIVAQDVVESGCSLMELMVHDWNSRAKERGAVDYTEKTNMHIYRIPITNLEKNIKNTIKNVLILKFNVSPYTN